MEAELTLEPLDEQSSEPVAFSPERPATAALDSIGIIPPQVAERVTIAPPPSWVVERLLEQETPAPTASNSWLLIDHQSHAERHEYYRHIVRKLDTINAVQEAAQWRTDFNPRSDRLTIHSLTVVRGAQRTENAKMSRFRILQREAGLESLVIDGLLTVVALLEDVRVGDMLDLSYTVQSHSPVFSDHFWSWITVPEHLPLQVFCVSVRFAAARVMQWKSSDSQWTPAVCEGQEETEWSWRTSAPPRTDMEEHVPAWNRMGKWIQISDFASWAEIAAGLATVWKEDLDDPEIVRLAEKIIAETTTPVERATHALTFLQDEIRYLVVTGDLGGGVPAAPGPVIHRGFGDCKDKSFAAAHLLRRLGIPARPVLVHSILGQAVEECLPIPSAFNHAIVEYELEGQRRWVDVTATLQGGNALFRPGAQFQLGLPIGPGVLDLEPIATDASSDRMELRETFLIDTSGRTSSLRVVVTATGREAERWRRSMAEEGVEVFSRWREQFYKRVFPNAKRAGKLEWEDDRENNEFVLGEVFDLHELGTTSQGRQGVRFRLVAHTIQPILGIHPGGRRRSPWALPFPCRMRHIIELDSPSLKKPRGQSARVEGAAFRFSTNWHGHQGFTSITFNLQTLKESVPTKEFETFRADVREVLKHLAVVVTLPAGSSVPWKKRAPENVLPPRRKPASSRPLERPSAPDEYAPPSTLEPVSPEAIAPVLSSPEPKEKSGLTPRREKGVLLQDSSPARERNKIRRPNPTLPGMEELVAASSSRRGGRRRAKRARQRLLMGIGVTVGALLLLTMLFFLFHKR